MENKETKAESLAEALERKRDADYMLLGCACGIIECYQKYGVVSIASIDQYNELKEIAKQRMKDFNGISDQVEKNITKKEFKKKRWQEF
jgi:NAD-dependent DNA ligase